MGEKPNTLRLADELDAYHTAPRHKQAAAELRHLHALNTELLDALRRVIRHIPADAGGASLSDDMHRARKVMARATSED